MKGAGRSSCRDSEAKPKCGAEGSRDGKTASKGKGGKSKNNARSKDVWTGHPDISSNSEYACDSFGKGKHKGKSGGFGGMSKGTTHGKGKGASHAARMSVAAQDRHSEPKCVMILQQRYGCEVGTVLETEGQSKDGKNWLEARHGGTTLPKSHEGIGWKRLHGDVERPKLIRALHGLLGPEDVMLRVGGETEDHRSWLTECGEEIPKAFINVYWEPTSSSSEGYSSEDDSSDGHVDSQQRFGFEKGQQRDALSRDVFSDTYSDCERFPEYLRDERPDLDSDGLEDLYYGMLQDDAEEFGGYQCDSD